MLIAASSKPIALSGFKHMPSQTGSQKMIEPFFCPNKFSMNQKTISVTTENSKLIVILLLHGKLICRKIF